jgi:acetylornithine deacetylase/succinyl-diaminopimelate desuccinylase
MTVTEALDKLSPHFPADREVQDLLVSLVKVPSHPGVPRQEEAVVKELSRFLQSRGITPEIQEVREGRPNLLASVGARRPGPHLLFCGHTDTVPPNVQNPEGAFSVVEKDGRLHGRGTVDMKGALAAMACALTALKKAEEPAFGRATLAAVIDEEMESLGAEDLIRRGFKADGAVVGEPTSNRIAIGHKGLEWLQIDFEGRAAHGGTPQAGLNAISAAAHFVHLVEEELIPAFEKRRDPLLGLPVINLGTIAGGDQPSTVAAHCRIKLDRRWVTTETIEMVFEDLEELLRRVREARPGLKTQVSRMPGGMATMLHGPLTISPDDAVVRAAETSLTELGLPAGPPTVFPAWTDAALISKEGKIPAIVWGPGELEYAHSPKESIKLDQVFEAVRLYALAAWHFTRSR